MKFIYNPKITYTGRAIRNLHSQLGLLNQLQPFDDAVFRQDRSR